MRLLLFFIAMLLAPALTSANTLIIKDQQGTVSEFSMSDLEMMPQSSYTTHLPWFKGKSTFTGVDLSYLLLNTLGSVPDAIELRALNDYAAVIRKADLDEYSPILAYHKDGKMMRVRDKGPFWVIYSLDKYPELDTPHYQGQMVWQLKSIQVVNDDK